MNVTTSQAKAIIGAAETAWPLYPHHPDAAAFAGVDIVIAKVRAAVVDLEQVVESSVPRSGSGSLLDRGHLNYHDRVERARLVHHGFVRVGDAAQMRYAAPTQVTSAVEHVQDLAQGASRPYARLDVSSTLATRTSHSEVRAALARVRTAADAVIEAHRASKTSVPSPLPPALQELR